MKAWHGATALVAALALGGQFAVSLDRGLSPVDFFSYFTIQSNLLILATELWLVMRPGVDTRWFRLTRLAGLTGITVTCGVFAVLIGPHVHLTGLDWWLDKGLHLIVPLMAIAGHLLPCPRPSFRWSDLWFVAWPVAWLGWTFARASWGSPRFRMPDDSFAPVPYDFLDVTRNEAIEVIAVVVGITVLMLGVASCYIGLASRQRAQR